MGGGTLRGRGRRGGQHLLSQPHNAKKFKNIHKGCSSFLLFLKDFFLPLFLQVGSLIGKCCPVGYAGRGGGECGDATGMQVSNPFRFFIPFFPLRGGGKMWEKQARVMKKRKEEHDLLSPIKTFRSPFSCFSTCTTLPFPLKFEISRKSFLFCAIWGK